MKEPLLPSRAATEPMFHALARRPDLWLTALAAVRRLAVPGWWKRRPYLPLPDARFWEFRMVTAYGRGDADPLASDVVSYLEWCRSLSCMGATTRPREGAPHGDRRRNPPPRARRG